MKELIPITTADIGGTTINAVNARELHEFLENKDRYTTWIKDRIEQFGFVENQDFVTFSENSEKGRPRKEYFVSIDMAKELAMVERNAKGKEARLYFIECERIAKQKQAAPALPDFPDPAAAAVAWAEQYRQRQALEAQIEADKPKVEFFSRIVQSDTEFCISDVAKMLGYGVQKFFIYLRQKAWMWQHEYRARSEVCTEGYMAMRVTEKNGKQYSQPVFLGKGIFKIYQMMLKDGLIERNPQIEMSMK